MPTAPGLEIKSFTAAVTAVDGDPAGVFEAIVSVFGNVDHGGDRVLPGAFATTLAAWEASGNPIPVIWSHEWDDPESHIGWVEFAEERPEGLYVKAQLDVDANSRAAYVAQLLIQRRVTQFSFGYQATEVGYVVEDTGGPYAEVREIAAIDLFEVGPTLLGMNPATELISAASVTSGARKTAAAVAAPPENDTAEPQDEVDDAGVHRDPPNPEAAARIADLLIEVRDA